MNVYEHTLRALWQAELHMKETGFKKPCLAVIFAYLGSIDGAPTSRNAILKDTKINDRRVKDNFRVLEEMEFISTEPCGNNQITVTMNDIFGSLDFRSLSSLLSSIKDSNASEEDREGTTKAEADGFSVADIKMDADWKTAEAILLKYFKPHQIDAKKLTYKKRFSILCELLSDKSFDFDAYCQWYRVEKYPDKLFNYGLFLYPDMIMEFKDSTENNDSYLNTTSNLANSESHKRGVKETKEFINSLED